MNRKKILGLDLGTNSIGWSLVNHDFDKKEGEIIGLGSRIIPMSQDIIGEFQKGNSISQTAERTRYRGVRRLRERHLLRRERLHRVLHVLGFLPKHYEEAIDFEQKLGKFKEEVEPKIAYKKNWNVEKERYQYSFLFQSSFDEMMKEFIARQPEMVNGRKVPYDWTIYYLRKKALTERISKEELSWIILNFNQKRGYYQLREEEDQEKPNKLIEYYSLKVVDVLQDEIHKSASEPWYSLILENGWVYRRSSKIPLFEWKDKTRDFIVTTDLNEDGTLRKDKEGNVKRSFRAPGSDDWTLIKKKTEKDIEASGKTVGEFIYETLLDKPDQKIKGKLVRTIERHFYKDELKRILEAQKVFHKELQDQSILNDCIRELYRNNESHQVQLCKRDLVNLILNDILFYQRPLKSKKSLIAECALEFRTFTDKDGRQEKRYLKAIPKSHPCFQEFRVWQWIHNLRIYKKDSDVNVTADFLPSFRELENLYRFLSLKKEIKQDVLLQYLMDGRGLKGKMLKAEVEKYRWNYVEDKTYPCNETAYLILSHLSRVEGVPKDFLTQTVEHDLWHLIYSVKDKVEFEKALRKFASKHCLNETSFVDCFRKFPPFEPAYGSFSKKALMKLLPLMRVGEFWKEDDIQDAIRSRIEKILNAELDSSIPDRVRDKVRDFNTVTDFQGLPVWLASYIIYGRHSEAGEVRKWNSVEELERYLKVFNQHSLRNPIVEQVVTETLRVVRDIWIKYGNGNSGFFDEIHVELGRDMKNTADERNRLSSRIVENENTNLRIKSLLAELSNDHEVENVRPYSPAQQEILKIYEDGVLSSSVEVPDDILKISKTAQPSRADLLRYKLWLEQKYRSPYTGEVIPLNRLFTPEYEVEHIIPQSVYFDDSFNNKVICESAVNKLKDNELGLAFIKNHHGEIVQTGLGKSVQIFSVNEYEDFVSNNYAKNRSKKSRLLMEEIPEKMIERQLNDTRYISKFICNVLSNIVRSETNDDGVNSKNLVQCNGKITAKLRNDWGLNNLWNDLILPRFVRMNALIDTQSFTALTTNHQKLIPSIPLEFSKGFDKKRIDHRHHAVDALIIACTSRDHVNLLNNLHAKSRERFDLQRKLRLFERASYYDQKNQRQVEREVPTSFSLPWENFANDARAGLEQVIVSFKQNLRIINKTRNIFESWDTVDGAKKKVKKLQSKGNNWSIRKAMHQETVAGLIKLRLKREVSLSKALDDVENIVDRALRNKIKSLLLEGFKTKEIVQYFKGLKNEFEGRNISRVEVWYWGLDENDQGLFAASRVNLDESFNEKRIKESIADTAIQKILLRHLEEYKNRTDEKGRIIPPEILAFSPEGIEEMNKNIVRLNNGKIHQPILKVRTYEPRGNKFNVGEKGNKKNKFVIAAKNSNLFFAVYEKDGKRNYETIPLNEVIEYQKWRAGLPEADRREMPFIPINNDKGVFLFSLSPNDLVYVPDESELAHNNSIGAAELAGLHSHQVYKVVSFTGNRLFCVRHDIAIPIVNKVEFSALNKMERSIEGIMIKERCVKLEVSRLGEISMGKTRRSLDPNQLAIAKIDKKRVIEGYDLSGKLRQD